MPTLHSLRVAHPEIVINTALCEITFATIAPLIAKRGKNLPGTEYITLFFSSSNHNTVVRSHSYLIHPIVRRIREKSSKI